MSVVAHICPYADEVPASKVPAQHHFCGNCPDMTRISQLCDEWHCDKCEHPTCPCHMAPTERRVAAHNRFWKYHTWAGYRGCIQLRKDMGYE